MTPQMPWQNGSRRRWAVFIAGDLFGLFCMEIFFTVYFSCVYRHNRPSTSIFRSKPQIVGCSCHGPFKWTKTVLPRALLFMIKFNLLTFDHRRPQFLDGEHHISCRILWSNVHNEDAQKQIWAIALKNGTCNALFVYKRIFSHPGNTFIAHMYTWKLQVLQWFFHSHRSEFSW